MYHFSERSLSRLEDVHPDLVRVVKHAITLSEYDFAVTEGLRSRGRQKRLVEEGRSRTYHSRHLLQSDGYSHAVDVMAVGDLDGDGDRDAQDRSITWDRAIYCGIAHAMYLAAKDLGVRIRWGGDFKTFYDGPHFELA